MQCHTSPIPLSSSPPSSIGFPSLQPHHPHYNHNHEAHIRVSHQCDHKHHPNTSTNTSTNAHSDTIANPHATANQMQTPVQMWVPPPSHVHEVSHNTCTSDPCQQLDASGSWRCQGLSVRQRASRVVQESPTLTSCGLLKGRSVPCSCLPSNFYVVGIPFYLKFPLVDKEYILHCHWHKYRRTCKNKNKLN